ncbi:ABC transporter permease [Nocardioides carbamazepini]|uniref:ABC transporter permease n=1 Tax=Nocardioides carbamazepini TaxID=2854259 RepID=UPI00214A4C47|nr:ABC transporter permease [Nocardioides carbamazepini]MCR1786132.1 ABC transporter permease [Nocardioides carbamazepini]
MSHQGPTPVSVREHAGADPAPEVVVTTSARRPGRENRQQLSNFLWKYSVPILFLVILIGASLLRPETFATYTNITAVLSIQALVLIIALAGMLEMLTGEFDLSLANNTALVAALTIGLQVKQDLSWPLAIGLALLASIAVGALNAFLVVVMKVSSFVATLGTYTLLSGVWIWYLGNQAIVPEEPLPTGFTNLGRHTILGLTVPFWVAIGLAIVIFAVLKWLPLGRRIHAVGANRRAAELAGVRPRHIVAGTLVVAALIAGIAGVLLAAQYGGASPGAGSALIFPAFAGVFLGATTIDPGRFNVLGTVLAVYTLAFMVAGLQQLGGIWSEAWVTPTFNGLTVIVAVSLSAWAFSFREKRAGKDSLARLSTEGEDER